MQRTPPSPRSPQKTMRPRACASDLCEMRLMSLAICSASRRAAIATELTVQNRPVTSRSSTRSRSAMTIRADIGPLRPGIERMRGRKSRLVAGKVLRPGVVARLVKSGPGVDRHHHDAEAKADDQIARIQIARIVHGECPFVKERTRRLPTDRSGTYHSHAQPIRAHTTHTTLYCNQRAGTSPWRDLGKGMRARFQPLGKLPVGGRRLSRLGGIL